jgi:hypothetical protein
VHRNRAKPPARHPHRRKSRNSCSTNRGSPSPPRSDAACARKVSKWSRTIPYRMLDVGSRGSYALDGCATRRLQARRVPTRGTGQIRRECLDRVSEAVIADNRGCHRVQIDSSAGGISGPPRPHPDGTVPAFSLRGPVPIEATRDNVWPEWPPKNTSEPRWYALARPDAGPVSIDRAAGGRHATLSRSRAPANGPVVSNDRNARSVCEGGCHAGAGRAGTGPSRVNGVNNFIRGQWTRRVSVLVVRRPGRH